MVTTLQRTANRINAIQSTGPKTVEGKARSSQNALRHGLRSEQAVIPGECPEAWEAHHEGILRDLTPTGVLERSLADRVALCLWRLNRVVCYETAVTTIGIEEVEEEVRSLGMRNYMSLEMRNHILSEVTGQGPLEKALEDLRAKRQTVELWEGTLQLLERLPHLADDERVNGNDAYGVFSDLCGALHDDIFPPDFEEYGEFLANLGVPRDERDAPYEWDGWTAGMVRQGAEHIARAGEADLGKLLSRAARDREEIQESMKAEARRLEARVKALRQAFQLLEDRMRQRRMLPDDKTLEKITRYEAHLTRQMLQALHTLERLRANRKGEPVPPPAALDVTVNGKLPASTTAALEYAGSR